MNISEYRYIEPRKILDLFISSLCFSSFTFYPWSRKRSSPTAMANPSARRFAKPTIITI